MPAEMSDKIDQANVTHATSAHPTSHHDARMYYVIFAWLMGLLVLTVVASLIPFDRVMPGLNVIVALIIAVVKAALVMLFFMHVKESSKLTWIFATAAFLWLMIMIGLTFNDYFTRQTLVAAPKYTPAAIRSAGSGAALEHVNANVDQHVVSGEGAKSGE
jgi:cytochrome c oxidase subunit 4